MANFLDIAPKRKTPAARKVCVDKIRLPAARQSLCRENPDPGPAKFFVYRKSGPASLTDPKPTAPFSYLNKKIA